MTNYWLFAVTVVIFGSGSAIANAIKEVAEELKKLNKSHNAKK